MSPWQTLLYWLRRANATRRNLVGSVLAAVISQLVSHALTIGAPLLLVLAWSQRGSHNPLQQIAVPLVLIEVIAFLRSPLRYVDRMNSHRLGIGAVSTWRQWLTEQVSRWSFRTMSATSRVDLLAQSVLDIDSLQQIWLRVTVPLISSLMSYLITCAATVAVVVTFVGMSLSVWVLIGVALLTLAVLAVLASQLSRIVSRLHALRAMRTSAFADLYGLQQLASELTLLRTDPDHLVAEERVSVSQWRDAQGSYERWWHRIDVTLVVISSIGILAAAVTTTYLTLSGPWEPRAINVGIVGVLFASLSGEVFAQWRIGLEAAGTIVVTGNGLTARNTYFAGGNKDASWPQAAGEFSLPGVLTFVPGEMVAVVGPSGSGKSTWLRGVAQLDDEQSTLLVNGVATTEIREDELREHLVHVATEPRFLGTRLSDELTLGRTDLDDFSSLLRDLRLSSDPTVRPALCSRGERHRYAIARALLRRPDVLLLDEPTAGLGETERDAVLSTIRSRAVSVLIATHDPAVIASCDHVVSIDALRG